MNREPMTVEDVSHCFIILGVALCMFVLYMISATLHYLVVKPWCWLYDGCKWICDRISDYFNDDNRLKFA